MLVAWIRLKSRYWQVSVPEDIVVLGGLAGRSYPSASLRADGLEKRLATPSYVNCLCGAAILPNQITRRAMHVQFEIQF